MPPINLRRAVKNVRDYITEFNDLLENNFEDLMIEETELSEDEKYWLITVGFSCKISRYKQHQPPLISGVLANNMQQNTIERDYKVFKVDSSTGQVVSMKMYKF